MSDDRVGRSWTEQVDSWRSNHFAISDFEANVSRLLRKVADAIDELGPIDVMDVTFCREVEGPEFSMRMTVYFKRKSAE